MRHVEPRGRVKGKVARRWGQKGLDPALGMLQAREVASQLDQMVTQSEPARGGAAGRTDQGQEEKAHLKLQVTKSPRVSVPSSVKWE